MRRLIVIYKQFDVVVVPFPFTDMNADKRRPALVLSTENFNKQSENCVLAMITSQNNPDWPLDTRIGSLRKAGLKAPSKIRMKLFTLDSRLIIRKMGGLSGKDRLAVVEALHSLMNLKTE
ncbi:MAG: type II toxin-antitoxin system PemK/MazF family toxin [Desulfobacterales bacterium]|nr:type II toxin-antitoxin system PemK/MazF family toxin [Desulfobacterales bacterium]